MLDMNARSITRHLFFISFLLCTVLYPHTVSAQEEVRNDGQKKREGFTFEIGLGVGFWHVVPYEDEPRTQFMPVGVSLSLGFFLTEDCSLMLRTFSNFSASDDDFQPGEFREPNTHYFIGPNFQYWIGRRLFIGGGAGYTGDEFGHPGFGVNFRTGFPITFCGGSPLRVGLEIFAKAIEGYIEFGEVISLEYQFY
jgi:hypothetical protein